MQTRILSRLRFLIDGYPCRLITASNVEQDSWMGYFFQPAELCNQIALTDVTQQAVEIKVNARVDTGLRLKIQITNYSKYRMQFEFGIECGADFADLGYGTVPPGLQLTEEWRSETRTLQYTGRATHTYERDGQVKTASMDRGSRVCVSRCAEDVSYSDSAIRTRMSLEPGDERAIALDITYCDKEKSLSHSKDDAFRELIASEKNDSARFSSIPVPPLAVTFDQALSRAADDMLALQDNLKQPDHDCPGTTNARLLLAGIPKYTSLFGRDSMKASWQASILEPDLMKAALCSVASYQGTVFDDWIDERPGRMPHEVQSGPLSHLRYLPSYRNYGTATSAPVFAIVLAEMWRWTGDGELVKSLLPAAIKALKDCERDWSPDIGFYNYLTRSPQGVKNQGWKDSEDAIVYPDGSQVSAPIYICSQQGYMYLAKVHLAGLLELVGDPDPAKQLRKDARELKERFNDVFWMPDEQYFAMGLDAEGKQIRSVSSDAGHCLATGIVDDALAPLAVQRMFRPDLFNGWGIRTLSSDHPAYNPWSYHRGSVWPVEQATFCLGLRRHNLMEAMWTLAKSQVEALQLFSHTRFPELFAGHQRSPEYPFPGIYPEACWPQAWSSSAPLMLLHSMLGVYTYAPARMLLLDPQLPEWLPQITVHNLRIDSARVSLRFTRQGDFTKYEIIDQKGELHVKRRQIHWHDIEQPGFIDGIAA